MAQVTYLDNFYPIVDLANWPGLVSKLEWTQGKQIAEHANEITFDVIGREGRAEGLWTLTMGEKEGVKGIFAELDGQIKINDPMFGELRSAEDLVTMLIQLRQVNNPGQFAGRDIDSDDVISRPLQETPPEGYSHFYQFRDPLTWLEAAARLMPFGDIEQAGTITIKTSAPHLDSGIYTLTKTTVCGAAGILVELDGGPQFNYPRPHLRSAEDVVDTILKLHAMFSTAEPIDRPKFESAYMLDASPAVVVASAQSNETVVKLFANGLITISNPGLLTISPIDGGLLAEALADVLEDRNFLGTEDEE